MCSIFILNDVDLVDLLKSLAHMRCCCEKLLPAFETQAVRKVQWPPSPVAKCRFWGKFRVFQDAK